MTRCSVCGGGALSNGLCVDCVLFIDKLAQRLALNTPLTFAGAREQLRKKLEKAGLHEGTPPDR